MGKKRIIKQDQEELIKEREKIENRVQNENREKFSSSRVKEGRIYLSSTYNNTIITLTDSKGNVLSWSSAGSIGFKGTKKATPFAASKVAEVVFQAAQKMGIQRVSVSVKGVGGGRDSAIRSLAAKGMEIVSITDVTPVPHDGPRLPKVRRV